MKKVLLFICFCCTASFTFGQLNSSQTSTTDFIQFDYNRSDYKRIAQAFLSDKTAPLESITIRLSGGRGTAQGGKMAIDLVEIQHDGTPTYLGMSEYKTYHYNETQEGIENTFKFGAGLEIKQGMAYYFVVRSNHFFRIVGANNTDLTLASSGQPTRGCFYLNSPYNKIDEAFDVSVLQAAQALPNDFNMYYTINLKENGTLLHAGKKDHIQLDYNRTPYKRVVQQFKSNQDGTLEAINIRLKGTGGTAQGGKLSLDLYEMDANNQYNYVASSEYKGYYYVDLEGGKLNTFRFGPSVQIKNGKSYRFVVRSNNFFQISGAKNSSENGMACFFMDKPYNKIDEAADAVFDAAKAQTVPDNFNMFFAVTLKDASPLPMYGINKIQDIVDSKMFDAAWYAQNNSDIAQAGFAGVEGAKRHFIQHGCKEGRQSGPLFDVKAYKSNHSDLGNLFKDDFFSYYVHYMNYGILEGRKPTK